MSALNDLIWGYLFGGSSGSADVTAAAVAVAIGSSNATQQNTIRNALNVPQKPSIVDVEGTVPTITPAANTVYHCGELTSLTINNPPAHGAYSIVFTSGATATTTTFPATILGLEDFAAEANTLYEINVLDNRAVVCSWAVSA